MDDKKLSMVMTILKVVLVVVGVIACFSVIMGANGDSTIEEQEKFLESGSLAFAINFTIFIIVTAAAATLVFFLLQLITTTKKTALSIAGVLAALLVYLIFWAMGSSDTNETLGLAEKVAVAEGSNTIGVVTAGIYTAFIGIVVGVLVWILSPLMGRLRK